MRGHPKTRFLISAMLVAWTAACTRGASIESEPGPAYALEVDNPMPYPMIVSYDDGTGTHLLGTVAPSGSTRFVITRPSSRQIEVVATDEGRTHTVTRSVTLQSEGVTRVRLSS